VKKSHGKSKLSASFFPLKKMTLRFEKGLEEERKESLGKGSAYGKDYRLSHESPGSGRFRHHAQDRAEYFEVDRL
jgi:hypothetical protein